MAILNYLKKLSPVSLSATWFALVLILGLVDYVTGPEVGFSIFYLFPVAGGVWFVGRRSGVLLAILAAATWLVAELAWQVSYAHFFIPYWNATMRLGLFVAVSILLSTVKEQYQTLDQRVTEKAADIVRLNRVYAVLSNVNQAIVRMRDQQELFDAICRIGVNDGKFKMAWIGIVDEKTQRVTVKSSEGLEEDFLDELDLSLGDHNKSIGPAVSAINGCQHFVCNDIERDARQLQNRKEDSENALRSCASFPLKLRGKCVGALTFYSTQIGFFNQEEVALLDEMAMDVSFFLDVIEDQKERNQADEALRYNELRFRALIENSQDGITLVAADGTVLYDSPAITRLLGYDPNERLGRKIFEFLLPDGLESFKQHFAKFVAKLGAVTTSVGQFRHKDGSWRWVEAIRTNLLDEPSIQAIVVNYRDITERKRAEEQIEMLAHALRSIRECVSVTDVEDRILFVNDAFLETYGYREEELLGKNVSMLRGRSLPHEIEYSILPKTIEGGWHGEIMNRRKNGDEFPIYLSTSTVKDEKGNPVALIGVAADITEQKRSLLKLDQLSTAVEQSPASIIITDKNGTIEYVNSKFAEVTGYESSEVIGRNPSLLKSGKTPDDEYRKLWKTILSGAEWRGLFENKKKDGTTFWEQASISPIRDPSGVITHFVAVKEDITERRGLEQQLVQAQKLESIGTLASGIAHDFNNLLSIILGYSSLLQHENAESERITKSTEAISSAVERGAALVRQILTFARKTKVAFAPVNLGEMIKELGQMMIETFPKNIEVLTSVESELPPVNADRTQIYQTLLNLCVNARDAMPNGGTLRLLTSRTSGDMLRRRAINASGDDFVTISILDSGTGMDESTKRRIFEPFFTTKGESKGTGLGLSVVYGIVKSHHGHIEVLSSLGKGTRFDIHLPIPQGATADAKVVSKGILEEVGGMETILIIEDETTLRELLKATLENKGYTILTAPDGKEGVKWYRKAHSDIALVISDLGLPKLDGTRVLQELLKINPNVKVLIASGNIEPGLRSGFLMSGAKGFIQKPYIVEEVLQKIRKTIDAV